MINRMPLGQKQPLIADGEKYESLTAVAEHFGITRYLAKKRCESEDCPDWEYQSNDKPGHKYCPKCKTIKAHAEFDKDRSTKSGLSSSCKKCRWENGIRFRFNISKEEYNELFNSQGGKCAICGKHQKDLDKALAIDHDHDTGEIRELLCFDCNIGIAKLHENPEIMIRAIDYIKKHKP